MPIDEKLIIELQAKVDTYIKNVDSAADITEKNQRRMETSLTKVSDSVKRATVSSGNLSREFSTFGRSAGQAGIQIQQFIGQIQGGQSAFLALSQQSADLGFVLGSPLLGAVAGISASIASFLVPSLFNAKSNMELFLEVAARLDPVLSKAKDGTQKLSEELLGLANLSETLARVKVAKGIIDAEKAIDTAINGIVDNIEELPSIIYKSVDDISKAFQNAGGDAESFGETVKSSIQVAGFSVSDTATTLKRGIDEISKAFDLNVNQSGRLAIALGNVRNEADQFNIQTLVSTLEDLNVETGFSNNKLIEFTNSFEGFFTGLSNSRDQINALRVALVNFQEARKSSEEDKGIIGSVDLDQTEDIKVFFQTMETMYRDDIEAYRQSLIQKDRLAALYAKKRAMQEIASNNIVQGSYSSLVGSIGQIMANGEKDEKKRFEVQKKASIAQTAINTSVAAMKAYSQLGVYAAPAVAAIIATGAAQIAAISSQSYEGGGSTASSGSAGGPSSGSDFQSGPSSIGVSVTDTSGESLSTQKLVISTEDGENIFEGIAKKTQQLTRDGVV